MGVADLDKTLLNRRKGNPVYYSESRFEQRNGVRKASYSTNPLQIEKMNCSLGCYHEALPLL